MSLLAPITVADRIAYATSGVVGRVPLTLLQRLQFAPLENDRGIELDRHVRLLLGIRWISGHAGELNTVCAARSDYRASSRVAARHIRGPAEVTDTTVAGLPARLYRAAADDAPALVFFHGGGWVIGDLDTHDPICRRIAFEADVHVIAIDYRLAPEAPFPAAVEDACAAYRDVVDRREELGFAQAIGVGGDSAGGNLAAVVCLAERDRDHGRPPDFQFLIYPGTDMRRVAPSHRIFADGFLLTADWMTWFLEKLRPDVEDPRASPLLADSHAGLPPALIVTAGFDPLRDEGEFYAEKLRESGVFVDHYDAARHVHGFIHMDRVSPGVNEVIESMLRRFRRLAWKSEPA